MPVLRAGQTLGVLVVQNRDARNYGEDEIEAMLTTATLLAEMMSTSDFDAVIRPGQDIDLRRPRTFNGNGFSDGVALGTVVLHDPRVVVTNFVAEDTDVELARLREALDQMRVSIDNMLSHGDMQSFSDHREILESYRMFAHDRGWVDRLNEAISNGLTAEAAVERVQNDTRARMMRSTDPYIKDRLHDLDDLANRLLRILTGDGGGVGKKDLPENAVLVARNMGPADLLEYDRTRLRAVVLEEGAAISHVAIVAKSLGLVAVGQAENVVSLSENGDDIIVDGAQGTVHLRPTPDMIQVYVDKVRIGAKRRAHYLELKDKPAVTRDGVEITLLHNSGIVADLPMLHDTGASGVGLFRTELQFMIASRLPRLQGADRALYRGDPAHRGQADRLPPARYRRRQGDSVYALGARGESRHGLPLAAAGARPDGAAADPDPGAAAGGQWRADEDPRADGHRRLGVPADKAGGRQGGRAAEAHRHAGAE